MPEKLKLAVAGLVHDHVWDELERWRDTDRVDFVAAADPHGELTDRAREEFGVEHCFADTKAMFDSVHPDVVQICTSNAAGLAVVEQAAERGIHIVLEKPMAATLKQADRMLAATAAGDRIFLINWPFRWRPNTLHAWKLVEDGFVGDVFHATIRMAHKGPREFGCSDFFCDWLFDAEQNGGGAMIDYCCYGAVGFRHLFGMPNAVQAVSAMLTKTDINVEDNASITLIYDDRFAVTEASWSQIPSYHDMVFLGTTGTMWTEHGRLRFAREDGVPTDIPVEPLPDGQGSGPEMFLHCLDTGTTPPDVCDAKTCRDAQAILSAGQAAAESGSRIGCGGN